MRTRDFDYTLPPELIAQSPIEPRDHSRLMVLDRTNKTIRHDRFYNLAEILKPGDALVFNDTRVIPARLHAQKETGARLEILLLNRLSAGVWQTLVKPAKRLSTGAKLTVRSVKTAAETGGEVIAEQDGGIRIIRFTEEKVLESSGDIPLPPYIHEPLADPERYQTVYSRIQGSAAAPTAGLHFTPALLQKLEENGVHCIFVTLHVGLDTFQPVHEEDPTQHIIHKEFGIVSAAASKEIARAKREGRRVIGVGTTSTRLMEATAELYNGNPEASFADWVDLYIMPGYQFKVIDGLITNFHLPRTTLIMMISAFAGREFVLQGYGEAVRERYRFYSFGDAMLVL